MLPLHVVRQHERVQLGEFRDSNRYAVVWREDEAFDRNLPAWCFWKNRVLRRFLLRVGWAAGGAAVATEALTGVWAGG